MDSTATIDSPVTTGAIPAPPAVARPDTDTRPAIQAPAYRGPHEARTDWEALYEQLAIDGELVLDMRAIADLPRPLVSQVIRFLQVAETRRTQLTMLNVPPRTQAMLELLGVHHLVDLRGPEPSQG